jgi:hypothetical protein
MAALEFLWLSLFQSLYNYNSKPIHSILRSYISYRFCCCCLLIKAKHQHGKYHNKNTGLFINCMDFVVVRTKINKKKIVIFFFVMLGLCYHYCYLKSFYQIVSVSSEFGCLFHTLSLTEY